MSTLAPTLQAYFTDRLIGQRAASPNTIAAYKTTFRLLLYYPAHRQATQPARHRRPRPTPDRRLPGAPRTRPAQQHPHPQPPPGRDPLAVRLPRAAASRTCGVDPARARHPHKRTERNLVTYLTEPEVDALLDACDQTTWTGRRDHAMFALTIQTGLRISELAGLTRHDITLTAGAHVHTIGKGRKERRTPLVPPVKAALTAWLNERPGAPAHPLFPTTTGRHLSRDAIERRLAHNVTLARAACASLKTKRVTCTRCGTPQPCACCSPATTSP